MSILKISIVICTRNSEKTIGRVLKSIDSLNNSELIKDIIIVDFNSIDNTRGIVLDYSKIAKIKVSLLECLMPGKAPALVMGLNNATGDISIIVDDDNVLEPRFIRNALPILYDSNIGAVGTRGLAGAELNLPSWFECFSGTYAVGCAPDKPVVDWVWGAGCIINMKAWEILREAYFSFVLNPARKDNSIPIEIGGEDVELALAIRLIGFRLAVCSGSIYYHIFPQSRLNVDYLLKNARGVSRSTPIHNIYRIVILKDRINFPKLYWIFLFIKNVLGNFRLLVYSAITFEFVSVRYCANVIRGQVEGFLLFFKRFDVVHSRLRKLKNKSI